MPLVFNNKKIREKEKVIFNDKEVKNIVYNNEKVWHAPYIFGEKPIYLHNADNPRGMPTINYTLNNSSTTINLSNGLFRTTHIDTSEGNGVNSLGISHIYNSQLNCDYVDENIRTYMGVGFKLNILQYLIKVNENHYKYIDSNGVVHQIVMNQNVYYDKSGLGLTLSFASDESKKIYLKDRLGNKLVFNESGFLDKIEPILGDEINYNYKNDKLDSIKRGDGSASNKYHFKFYYNGENLLSYISSMYQDETKLIRFIYDDFDRLVKVYKQKGTNKETIVEYCYYENSHKLKRIENLQKDAIQFSYLDNGKLEYIYEGALSENNFIYKRYDKINYSTTTSTKVTSNQGVSYIYNFDINTKMSLGVYEEAINNNNYTYTSANPSFNIGYRVLDNALNDEDSFNSSKVFNFRGSNSNYMISNHSSGSILEEFDKGNNATNKFTCSAWVRINQYPNTNLQLKYSTDIKQCIVNVNTSESFKDSWQFVSNEIMISSDSRPKFFKVELLNNNSSDVNIDVSDVRIIYNDSVNYIENINNMKLDIRDIYRIQINDTDNYRVKDVRVAAPNDIFITHQDIEASLYNKYISNGGKFNFIHNNGTGLIANVNKVVLYDIAHNGYPLELNNDPNPIFYNLISMGNEISIKNYFIYTKEDLNDRIYQFSKAIKDSIYSFEKSSYSFNGLLKEKMDEYGVQTIYEHDNYGNVTKSTIQKYGDNDLTRKIINDFTYDNDYQNIEKNIGERGDAFDYSYINPQGNLHTIINPAKTKKTEMLYDDFNERLKCVNTYIRSNTSTPFNSNAYSKNMFYYNDIGQLSGIAHNNISYDLGYNIFGELENYSINGDRILEKYYNYNGENTRIDTKYGDNWNDVYSDIFDKYGRHEKKLENNQDKLKHIFKDYGNKDIATSGAKLRLSVDNYSNLIYNYHYNENDTLTGYSQTDQLNPTNSFLIQLENAHIEGKEYSYKICDDFTNYYTIRYDSTKLIKPRITSVYFSAFHYDELGRIIEKTAPGNKKEEYFYLPRYEGQNIVGTTNRIKTIVTHNVGYKSITSFDFDSNGNIIEILNTQDNAPENYTKRSFVYDEMNRLIKDQKTIKFLGKELNEYCLEYTYDSYGNRKSKKEKNKNQPLKIYTYVYDDLFKDQLKEVYLEGPSPILEKSFVYNQVGNPIMYNEYSLNWERGGLLSSLTKNNITTYYKYGSTGIRTSKIVNGSTTTFYLDDDKIVGESSDSSNRIKYYAYDLSGLSNIIFNNGTYKSFRVVKDGEGSIESIYHGNDLVIKFAYDAFGKCSIIYKDTTFVFTENDIPFRWKGYYYDIESGFYYINGNYYDPDTGRYINTGSIMDVLNNVGEHGLNLYSFADNNPISFLPYIVNVEPSFIFVPVKQKWYNLILPIFYSVFMFIVGLGVTIGGGWLIGVPTMVTALALATISVVDLIEHLTGNNVIKNALGWNQSTYNKVRMGLNIAAFVLTIACSIYSWYRATHPRMTQCFKKGTLIKAKEGYKKIEEIEVGDEVWAFDEKTNKQDLKKVVRLFRNQKSVTTSVTIDDNEPIVATPEHPFYVLNAEGTPLVNFEGRDINKHVGQWVAAGNLKVGHKVLLSNGKNGIITRVETEKLDEPITTYNFEVEDYHTYYVGKEGILVHNTCPVEVNPGTKEWNQAVKDVQNSANVKGKLNFVVKDQTTAQLLAKEAGLPLQTLDDIIYVHGTTRYTVGFEIHPIDNSVGMPHLKFWSGRTNGHIYWPGG